MSEFSRTIYDFNSRISLNDTETDPTKYVLLRDSSIADTIANNLEEDRPSDMGIVDYGVQMSRGEFSLPATLFADSLPDMRQLIQDLKEAFHPDLLEADPTYGVGTIYNGYHPFKWTEDIGGAELDVQVFLKSMEVPKVDLEDLSGHIRASELRLKADDPRKYNQDVEALVGAGTAANGGTINTPVTITITASGASSTSLAIANNTTGETIYITTALSDGEVLVLNTRRHTALLDGVAKRSYIGNNSEWFFLKPGDNTLAIANDANVSISFGWSDAYPL